MSPKLATVLALISTLLLTFCSATFDESPLNNIISSGEVGGHFALAPGVLFEYHKDHGYDYRLEYSPSMASVYLKYLKRPTSDKDMCFVHEEFSHPKHEGSLDADSFDLSFQEAGSMIEEYESITQSYLATDPRGMNASAFIYLNALHAKYNELLTGSIKAK